MELVIGRIGAEGQPRKGDKMRGILKVSNPATTLIRHNTRKSQSLPCLDRLSVPKDKAIPANDRCTEQGPGAHQAPEDQLAQVPGKGHVVAAVESGAVAEEAEVFQGLAKVAHVVPDVFCARLY